MWYNLRKSDWEGIVSTRYEPTRGRHDSKPAPDPKTVRSICIKNFSGKPGDNPDPMDIIREFPLGECYCGIDACDIPTELIPHKGVIWFQCPWDLDPGQLIREFLLNAAPN